MTGTLARFYVFRALGLTWLYVPFQWFYLRDRGLSATELMALNTVFCIAAVLLEVPTGALADRIGRRVVLIAGSLLSTLSCALFLAFSTSLLWLAVANVAAALAMTCISGADSAYLFELFHHAGRSKRYHRAESTSSAVRLLAAATGGMAATAMVLGGVDLAALYAVTAALGVVAAGLASTLEEPWRRRGLGSAEADSERPTFAAGASRNVRRAFALVLGRRDLVALLVLSAAIFPVLRIGLFLDQPFVENLGFATASLGIVYAAKDLLAAGAAAVTSALILRVGENRLLTALPIAAASALALMSVASGPGAVLLVVVPTIAFGVFSPLVRVYVNRRLDECDERATALSIEGMARRFGFALFSPLVGAAVDLWSVGVALALSAVWAGLGVLLALALPLRARRGAKRSPTRTVAMSAEVTGGARLGEA